VDESQADLDEMLEQRLNHHENESKLMNFIEGSERYAAQKKIAQRRALNTLANDYR